MLFYADARAAGRARNARGLRFDHRRADDGDRSDGRTARFQRGQSKASLCIFDGRPLGFSFGRPGALRFRHTASLGRRRGPMCDEGEDVDDGHHRDRFERSHAATLSGPCFGRAGRLYLPSNFSRENSAALTTAGYDPIS